MAPLPVDTVELPDAGSSSDGFVESVPGYRYEVPRLAPGSSIDAGDRTLRVLARAEFPRLAVLDGVLDAAECEVLIAMARSRLKPSTVTDATTGRDVIASQRSSLGMFFRPFENPLVAGIDRRIARIMNLPAEHGEGLQVLHYPQGAGSEPHFDFLVPSHAANRASIARSGQRVSTLVAYLNDVPQGGETVFPTLGWAVSPVRGNAVHFEYCNSLGEVDSASLHASLAVRSGEKWVATKWMRARPFVSA
jgi:prolyl 4-hydroxylase